MSYLVLAFPCIEAKAQSKTIKIFHNDLSLWAPLTLPYFSFFFIFPGVWLWYSPSGLRLFNFISTKGFWQDSLWLSFCSHFYEVQNQVLSEFYETTKELELKSARYILVDRMCYGGIWKCHRDKLHRVSLIIVNFIVCREQGSDRPFYLGRV